MDAAALRELCEHALTDEVLDRLIDMVLAPGPTLAIEYPAMRAVIGDALTSALQAGRPEPPPQVTRVEVIGDGGRLLTVRPCFGRLDYQDDGRTLKVFVSDEPTPAREEP